MNPLTPTQKPETPDSQEVVKAGNTSDSREFWIYQLKKSEMYLKLRKFQLELAGMVTERRKRLKTFLPPLTISAIVQTIPSPPDRPIFGMLISAKSVLMKKGTSFYRTSGKD